MEYDVSVCIMPFKRHELDRVIGYDGLIGPDGEFYKVCKRDSMSAVHDAFAETLIFYHYEKDITAEYKKLQEQRPHLRGINLAPKDILINFNGFVNYEYANNGPEITPPNPFYNGLELNDKQFLTIVELIKLNKDNLEAIRHLLDEDKQKIYKM